MPDSVIKYVTRLGVKSLGPLLLTTAFAVPSSSARASIAQKLYWGNALGVERGDDDGANVKTLVPVNGPSWFVTHVSLDVAQEKLYWIEGSMTPSGNQILRAGLDGASREIVVPDPTSAAAIAVDPVLNQLYFMGLAANFHTRIWRANGDGTDVQTVLDLGGTHTIADLTIDETGRKLYWLFNEQDTPGGSIERANLDGTGHEVLVEGNLQIPWALAVDPAAGKMYWSEEFTIWRANVDGTGPELLMTGLLRYIFGIAVDPLNDKLYWTEMSQPR